MSTPDPADTRPDGGETLPATDEQFRLLVQGVKDYAIFLLDPAGRIASWNAGAENIKGYRAEEVIGSHFSRFYPPEDVAAGKPAAELRQAVADGRVEDEGWRVRKDGTRFWANAVVTALKDEGGNLRGFAKVTRDLTERRAAEEALRRANETLEARVRERTAELSRANEVLVAEIVERRQAQERLAEADRRKDEFLAMLAHELRNPLAAARSAAQVLNLPGLSPAQVGEARGMIGRQVEHLVHLVDDLLDVSRVLRGKVALRPEPVELGEVLRVAAETARPHLDARGLQFDLTLPAGPVYLTGDRVRLTQVFANLLDNAAKFTDPPGRVELTAAAAGGEAVVRVRDTGVGVAPELLPKVFDLFVQADQSAARARAGWGSG
jgi:PAS domain S-box-containing protein